MFTRFPVSVRTPNSSCPRCAGSSAAQPNRAYWSCSKSVAFASKEDLDPISLEALPACRVVYIRFHVLLRSAVPFDRRQMGGRGRGMRMDSGMPPREHTQTEAIDQLESTLKPLSPKVFDVETPEQMAKAIAEIQKEL